MKRKNNRAQSLVAYALLLIVVVGVIVSMRVFIVRTVQAKFKQAGDVFGAGEQYARGVTEVTNLDALGINISPAGGSSSGSQGSIDPCSFVTTQADKLQGRIDELDGLATALEKRADEIDAQIQELGSAGAAGSFVNDLTENRNNLRAEAESMRKEIKTKQDELDSLKTRYPDCFKENAG